ncbi:MAG TPA: hypothetical protein VFT69_16930 [Pseudolabrys sp.]|nr:hypothetical protein [Pseudolabrys sp.]
MSFVGHMSSAAKRLVSAGYAIHIGPDKWTGQIFQITDAGRLALSDSKETDRG